MTQFSDLGLGEPLLRAVTAEGYSIPTPIQASAIPPLLAGRDLMGIAQTGTGKTAAFALPILHRLTENPARPAPKSARVLILTPTRELAIQIGEDFATYGKFLRVKRAVIFGGVGMQPQIKLMLAGVDVLIATPGRLLDLMNQGHLSLNSIEMFVLDEADRMLDMGFIHDVRKVVAKLPSCRQTILFSATMPQAVGDLARTALKSEFDRVEVTPVATTAEKVDQKVLFVAKGDKTRLLVDILRGDGMGRTIVFTRTKHGANRLAEQLQKAGLAAEAIHGNKSQGARQKALSQFRDGTVLNLIATDIAARGIDVDGVTHVINFDLPNEPESYVHRIGRTARAGASGIALSFCDAEEVPYLRDIERTTRQSVPVEIEHPFHSPSVAEMHARPHGQPGTAGHRKQPPRHGQPKGNGGAPKVGGSHAAPAAAKPVRSGPRPGGGKPGGRPQGSQGQGQRSRGAA